MKLSSLLVLPALVAASPVLEQRAPCNANNCLRAVRNSQSLPVRSSDCAAFLKATVTPATSTVYQTLTFTSFPTATAQATATTQQLQTATVTQVSTITDTVTSVVTQPETKSTTKTVTVESVIYQKRQETVRQTSIPVYATACADAAAYSSACSCLGVTPTTITVSAPVTTVIASSTVSSTTTTVETASTVTQLTTVTTSTVVLLTTVSSQTITTLTTPTTTTSTATATHTSIVPRNNCVASTSYNPGAFFDDSYTTYCDKKCNPGGNAQLLGTRTTNTFTDCIFYCDDEFALGFEAVYNYNTATCQCFSGVQNSIVAAVGYDCAVINGLGVQGGN